MGLPCVVSSRQDKNGGGLGQGLGRSCLSLFLHVVGPCLFFAWVCLVLFPRARIRTVVVWVRVSCVLVFSSFLWALVLAFGFRGVALCCFLEPG